ncbi:MAG: hypothetical protein IJ397_01335 [Lachnospiraceae bacterium]|nr:hypothetical protein [Lachnospiraceae bacterium]
MLCPVITCYRGAFTGNCGKAKVA